MVYSNKRGKRDLVDSKRSLGHLLKGSWCQKTFSRTALRTTAILHYRHACARREIHHQGCPRKYWNFSLLETRDTLSVYPIISLSNRSTR